MLNHIVLMGRLTRDPELRRTGSGLAVVSFSLAVDRDFGNRETGDKETDFIDVVAWRNPAEFVSKYFSKGRMAVVNGRLQIREWSDKEGNTLLHYALARVMRANPVFVSLPAGADERQPFDLLRDHGLDPDIPNAGGFSCNQIIGIIKNKLAAPREHNEFCEALLQNCG